MPIRIKLRTDEIVKFVPQKIETAISLAMREITSGSAVEIIILLVIKDPPSFRKTRFFCKDILIAYLCNDGLDCTRIHQRISHIFR